MIISNLLLKRSAKSITLSADIQFNNSPQETIYFKLDPKLSTYIYKDASPFLASVLLPCMKTGEDIYLDGEVSEKLLKSTKDIMSLIESWSIGLKKINVKASNTKKDLCSPKAVGAFFSGGVDSFYTYLKHSKKGLDKITHLIFVQGFDIELGNKTLYKKSLKNIQQIAKEEKIKVITLETNVAQIILPRLLWDFGHGGALAAVALLLRKKLRKVFISSAVRKDQLFPYGTHPDLDKLWSTEKLQVAQDGYEYTRLEKVVKSISKSPLALKYLRVCNQNVKGIYNCSHCFKCLLTMIELICAKALDKSQTFEKEIDLAAVSNMYYNFKLRYNWLAEANLESLRKQNREPELQKAIEKSLERSKKFSLKRKLVELVAKFDQKYNKRRLYQTVFRLNSQKDRNLLFKALLTSGLIK